MEFQKARGVKTWKSSVVVYGYFLKLTNLDKERAAQIVVLYLLDNKIVHSKSGKDLKHVSRAVIIKKVYLNLLMFSIPISNHVLS